MCDIQTTDRPRYREVCGYRRNRLRCKKQFRLKTRARKSGAEFSTTVLLSHSIY